MNVNSSQMKQAMKKMGMSQEELDAEKVIIVTADKEIVFERPSVSRVKLMGQETFQVAGEYSERAKDTLPEITAADIETVMQQTGKDREEAISAIHESNGDLAEAIMKLSE